MNTFRRATYFSSQNVQNSLSSFDESPSYTNGSLNTASQLSFGELSTQNSPLVDDKYLLFYQSQSGYKTRNMQQDKLQREISHQTLIRNNVKDMATVINQNIERNLNRRSQNEFSDVNNRYYTGSGKITKSKQFNQYQSLTQIIVPDSQIRNKKKSTLTNSDSKTYILDKSEYLSVRNPKAKLSFQGQFNSNNNSSSSIRLPTLPIIAGNSDDKKRASLSNQKPSLFSARDDFAIKIVDNNDIENDQQKSETPSNQIKPDSSQIPQIPQKIEKQKKEINLTEKFGICIQNFPSQLKKKIEKNEDLRDKLAYFRTDDIKSSGEQVELLTKFLVKCLKKLQKNSNFDFLSGNNENGNPNFNITQNQSKKKMLINCATSKKLRLHESLQKDICETVIEILQKFEIPSSLFNAFRKIIAEEWNSQLKCQSFAEQIGGYRNLVPIISQIESELIATFNFTKYEQEQLEIYNHEKLVEILKELIESFNNKSETSKDPAQNKDQSSYRLSHKQQQKPQLGDYIKTIKNVFQNRSKSDTLKENSPFFLMKYCVWNALFNSSESKYFPIEQKLFILSIIEKWRNEYFFMDYWKEDSTNQQRMNILFNTISSRQNLMQSLGPNFISNEKIFCKAILQYTKGQIDLKHSLELQKNILIKIQ